jgi:hypothetical protein
MRNTLDEDMFSGLIPTTDINRRLDLLQNQATGRRLARCTQTGSDRAVLEAARAEATASTS